MSDLYGRAGGLFAGEASKEFPGSVWIPLRLGSGSRTGDRTGFVANASSPDVRGEGGDECFARGMSAPSTGTANVEASFREDAEAHLLWGLGPERTGVADFAVTS